MVKGLSMYLNWCLEILTCKSIKYTYILLNISETHYLMMIFDVLLLHCTLRNYSPILTRSKIPAMIRKYNLQYMTNYIVSNSRKSILHA